MQEMQILSLGQEAPLKKEMAAHSSILAWRIPMGRGALWATVHGSQRVGQDLTTTKAHRQSTAHVELGSLQPLSAEGQSG